MVINLMEDPWTDPVLSKVMSSDEEDEEECKFWLF